MRNAFVAALIVTTLPAVVLAKDIKVSCRSASGAAVQVEITDSNGVKVLKRFKLSNGESKTHSINELRVKVKVYDVVTSELKAEGSFQTIEKVVIKPSKNDSKKWVVERDR
jgi:hypothetical protein